MVYQLDICEKADTLLTYLHCLPAAVYFLPTSLAMPSTSLFLSARLCLLAFSLPAFAYLLLPVKTSFRSQI